MTDTDLDRYLGWCGEICAAETERLFSPVAMGRSGLLYDLVLDYPNRGGKSLRPALAIATCLGLGGHAADIAPTAATLELYHNAFLIHDDIEDGSLFRRSKPALHIDHGVPIAINVGDAMLSMSLQPLLDNIETLGLGRSLRILQSIATMTRITVDGQAAELEWVRANDWDLSDDDYLAMVEGKTSWYSFIIPMQVGALAAGAAQPVVDAFEPFGRSLGASFQITDDLLNLRAQPDAYGKEIGGDLWEGKRTLMLLHALRSCHQSDRNKAVTILARARPSAEQGLASSGLLDRLRMTGDLSPAGFATLQAHLAPTEEKTWADVQWLYDLMHSTGSLDYARRVAAGLADTARRRLRELEALPDSLHRTMLEQLVDFVHERAR